MDAPEIEHIVLNKDMLVVSQPTHYVLDPFNGRANLIGKITVFHTTQDA